MIRIFGFDFVPHVDPWRVRVEFDLKNKKHVDCYLKVMKLLDEEGFIGDGKDKEYA